jgi:hypothetical protein
MKDKKPNHAKAALALTTKKDLSASEKLQVIQKAREMLSK